MIEEIFDRILSELDEQGQAELGDDWDEAVAGRLANLRDAYDGLTIAGREPIDYSELSTQAAYVFAYAIARAEFTYALLKRHRAALGEPIFPNQVARITSLGGGPGSEIAGIVKYLADPENGENVKSIKYWIFDKNNLWSDVCEQLVAALNKFLPIKLEYAELDLCDQEQCSMLSLSGDDLLILSFVISELCALNEKNQIEANLREIYKTIDNGAKVFYNDSDAGSFYCYFNETKKYVKGFGKISQKSEIKDKIVVNLNFGERYEEYMEEFGATPHLVSNALSKLLVRTIL